MMELIRSAPAGHQNGASAVADVPLRPLSRNGHGRARRYSNECSAVREIPKLPDEVQQNRGLAKSRMEELQDIFASRHSELCETLRAKLSALSDEVVSLKGQIVSLERELQEASAARTAREVESFQVGKPTAEPVSPSASHLPDEAPEEEVGRTASSASRPRSATNEKAGESGDTNADGGAVVKKATKDLYNQEVLSPILHRRRAEARFREASLVHETSINQMKAEIGDLERRMHKQGMWMKSVDEQILKAEITKTRYTIRLKTAQQRVKTLGENLSEAYENTTKMLEERLSIDDISAKNTALIEYLNVIGQADASNAADFIPNKQELLKLTEACKVRKTQAERFGDLVGQVENRQRLVVDIVDRAYKLHHLNEQIQTLWSNVPAALKESVFYKVPRGAMMHPATAIQQMQAALLSIIANQKEYGQILADNVANVQQRHCMSPQSAKTGRERKGFDLSSSGDEP